MFEEFEKNDSYSDLETQEHLFIEKEMEKSEEYSEKDKTNEGQERIWNQLYEYAEIVENMEINWISYDESIKDFEEIIQKQRNIPSTSRTEEEIAGCYDLKVEELEELLKNKKIFDFGCGKSELSKELKSKNINTDIISYDIKKESLLESEAENSVQGPGENLPFSDESFDSILATYSLPYWASSEDMIENNFKELLRVLKKDGTLCIAPITDISNRPALHNDPKLRNVSSVKEYHGGVVEILNKIQVKFINLLRELRTDDKYEIKLGKNYFHEMKYRNVDEINRRKPSIAYIKKIK